MNIKTRFIAATVILFMSFYVWAILRFSVVGDVVLGAGMLIFLIAFSKILNTVRSQQAAFLRSLQHFGIARGFVAVVFSAIAHEEQTAVLLPIAPYLTSSIQVYRKADSSERYENLVWSIVSPSPRGTAENENKQPFHSLVYFQRVLPGGFPGWFLLQPRISSFKHSSTELHLESVEFEKTFRVYATSPESAVLLLGTDFMAWCLDAFRGNWIHIEGNVLSLVYEGIPPRSADLEAMYQTLDTVQKFCTESGALQNPSSRSTA